MNENIPQDQPKQHLIDIIKSDEGLGLYDQPKQTIEESLVFGYEKKYTAKDMTDYAIYILNNKVITPFEWYKNNRQ